MSEAPQPTDLVTRLIGRAAPHEPLEERALVAEMEKRLFGRGTEPVTLHRYVILDRLGTGGTGAVYRAYDPELDRRVAIKLLHVRETDPTTAQELHARLLREAQAIAQLSHPNVIAVHDVGTYGQHESADLRERSAGTVQPAAEGVFMVMEYVEGMDLAQWLGEGSRPWREVFELFLAAGEGLQAAHAAGLVHRDFKPANVLLGNDGRVRVLDFGLARTESSPDPDRLPAEPSSGPIRLDQSLTQVGAVMGTPAFMAPEQHRGETADARADQFAFCVALFHGVYGLFPFAGKTIAALRDAKQNGELQRPPDPKRAPPWLHRALLRGLQTDPGRRYASMASLLATLRAGARRRKRVQTGLGLGAAATVGLIGAFVVGRAQPDTCAEQAEAQLQGAWDENVRATVRNAISPSPAWAAVERGLDAYALAWRQTSEDACQLAVGAGDRPRQQAGRILCLDRSLARLRELTLLLSEADDDLRMRAVDAVSALPPLEACQDQTSPGPQVPTDRKALAQLERDLARADALQTAGRYEEARAPASSALDAARMSGHRVGEARAQIVLARLTSRRGDPGTTEDAWHTALEAAERAGDDESSIAGWLGLARAVSGDPGRLDEAHRHASMACARVESFGSAPAMRADCLLTRGAIEKKRAHYPQARAQLEEALEIARRTHGEQHPAVAHAYNSLGNLFADMEESDTALAHYKRAREIRTALYGPEHPSVASVINNIALVHNANGDYTDALVLLERALAIKERAHGKDSLITALAVNNTGNALSNLGRHTEAIEAHRRVLAIRERELDPDHPDIAGSHTNIANGLYGNWLFAEADTHYRAALRIVEKRMPADHPRVASTLNNLAGNLLLQGKAAEARPLLERALRIREKAFGPDHPLVIASNAQIARVHHQLGNVSAAKTLIDKARADIIDAQGEAHPTATWIFGVRSKILASAGLSQEALQEAQRRVDGLEATVGAVHPFLVEALLDLAKRQRDVGNAAVALELLGRAQRIESQATPRQALLDQIETTRKSVAP